MALVLLVVVILFSTGIGLLNLGSQSRMMTARTSSEIAARCAADAGLTKAVFEMNEQLRVKPWNDSTLLQETCVYTNLSNSTPTYYSFTVSGDFSSGYTAESIGTSGRAVRKVTCSLPLEGLFEYAIFTQGDLTLKNGTTINWYNFNADDPPLQIGTNSINAGAISAKTGVTINGDVIVGVGGDPDVVIDSGAEAAIAGCVYSQIEESETPSITVPEYLQALPSSGSITSSTTITNSAKYDSINLVGNGTSDIVIIDGAVELYVIGDIRLGQGDELRINPDASLTIYLGGNLLVDNGSIINNLTMDASKLKIYGLDTCYRIDFKASGTFYGAIYTPNADVRLHNSVEVFGAIVSNSFIQDVNANFYYDASLRKVSADEIGVHFVVNQWCEE